VPYRIKTINGKYNGKWFQPRPDATPDVFEIGKSPPSGVKMTVQLMNAETLGVGRSRYSAVKEYNESPHYFTRDDVHRTIMADEIVSIIGPAT